MDIAAGLDAPCRPGALFEVVSDLATYPDWLGIVRRVVPAGTDHWQVDLGARLGPFSRSKRLRMRRSRVELGADDGASVVVFERDEVDGRTHAEWRMEAVVGPSPAGSRLDMTLYYGGSLWVPVLDRLLGDEIERGRGRLLELVAT